MPSTTSLLKSASSTRKRIQAQEDSLRAFEWQLSAQTYEDYLEYSAYLEKRQESATDQGESLSYAKAIVSARKAYTSNEIQRQQINILEGRAGTADKMETVKQLYFQAVDNGDLNLAQNLYTQWDGLSVKLQNEQDVAAKAFAGASSKAKDKFIKSLEKGVDDVTLPNGKTVTPLSALTQIFQETGDTVGTMKAAQETLEAIRESIIAQYTSATTQDELDKLEEKYGTGLANIDQELSVNLGGKSLNNQDIVNGIANDQLNNPKYGLEAIRNEATGRNEFRLKENNIERLDYVRQINPETGVEEYIPSTIRTDQNSLFFGTSDQGRGTGTQITDEGFVIGGDGKKGKIGTGQEVVRDPAQEIGNRLKELGIIAKTDGTTLKVKLPGESVERQATIQPDGSVRYYDDEGQLLEIGLVDRNLGSDALPQVVPKGTPRVVSPDEISDFGVQSNFGGTLSQASRQGERYLNDITGNASSPTKLVNGPINTDNNFSGFGTAVSSNLLQSASLTREAIKLQAEKQAMLQAQQSALQSSNLFNLNQTPVAQFASNGVLKSQLAVARPQATPRVVVAPPAPTPQINRVTVAAPTNRISSVSTARPSSGLTVR